MLDFWNSDRLRVWSQQRRDPSKWTRRAGLNETGFYRYALSDIKAPSDCFCRVSLVHQDGAAAKGIQDRLLHSWTILRSRHPLLDCVFEFLNDDLHLTYTSTDNALRASETLLTLPMFSNWETERNAITNCARIISDKQLSQLRVYQSASNPPKWELVLLCSHAISDGISITRCMHDLLDILCSKTSLTSLELSIDQVIRRLPRAMEAQMPPRQPGPRDRWREAIAHVLWDVRQKRKRTTIAAFPWLDLSPVTRQKVHSFSRAETGRLVRACRRQGLTIGHLIYATSHAAFTTLAKPGSGSWTSIGSPVNARRAFDISRRTVVDELVIALAFLDIALPCVEIEGIRKRDIPRIWTLARLARAQVHGRLEDPLFPYYSYISQERRVTERFPAQPSPHLPPPSGEAPSEPASLSFGSSAVGNIDRMISLPPNAALSLADLSIGMRARQGESLMHSYTFQGHLRLSLVYDQQLGDDKMQQWLEKTSHLMTFVLHEEMNLPTKL